MPPIELGPSSKVRTCVYVAAVVPRGSTWSLELGYDATGDDFPIFHWMNGLFGVRLLRTRADRRSNSPFPLTKSYLIRFIKKSPRQLNKHLTIIYDLYESTFSFFLFPIFVPIEIQIPPVVRPFPIDGFIITKEAPQSYLHSSGPWCE